MNYRTQAGQYDQAESLASEALAIEKKLGERKHQMIEIQSLLANIWDQVQFQNTLCPSPWFLIILL